MPDPVLSSDLRTSQAANAVAWRDIKTWLAPWAVGVLLVVSFLIGLAAASGAEDGGLYDIGLILAAASLLGLVSLGFRGRVPSFLAETDIGLGVTLILLVALMLVGLVLAAQAEDTTVQSVGYALFIVGVIAAGWNLKHYFDVRDRSGAH